MRIKSRCYRLQTGSYHDRGRAYSSSPPSIDMGSFCSSLGPRGPFTFATLTSTPFLMSWPRPLSAVYWSRRSLVKPQFSDAQMRCLHGDRGRVGVGAGAGLGVGLRVGLGLGLG